jgi:hypothetical protein
MKNNVFLGRLTVTNKLGDTDNDGDFDQIYSLGGRSFTIWNGTTGAMVYDSGDDLERITSTHPTHSSIFNASNGSSAAPKDRSDDKGPEPEGTAVASINGETYGFVSLERIGGVMMYNVTNPSAPVFTGYYNNRAFATNGPDRGAEGIIYIPDSLSPNGNALIILANEISSTLTIYQISTCAEKAGVVVTPSSPAPVCVGNTVTLTATTVSNTTYQWYLNGSPIVGATNTTYTANASGDYQLFVTNSTHACSGKTDFVDVIVNPLPTITATTTNAAVCIGTSSTLNGVGGTTYNWMPGNLSGSSVVVTPSSATTYTVTGTDANGCVNTATVSIAVNALPTITATAANASICSGASTILTGNGGTTYNWMPGNLSGTTATVSPTSATTYTVTGTDVNGCSNTNTVSVAVNSLPSMTASTSSASACSGSNVVLSSSGASSYNWMPVNLNGSSITINPTSTITYTVTGTNANGCTNTATVTVNVLTRPAITATASQTLICSGDTAILSASGASTYFWLPGLLTGSSVGVTPSVNTTYTLTGTGSNGCSNTTTVSIVVNTSPSITASASSSSLCGTDTITFNASGANSYLWMPLNTSGSNVTDTPTITTTYTVVGTDGNGCTDSQQITVQVNTIPTVVINPLVQDSFCTSSSAVTLSASPSGGVFSGPGISGSNFDPASSGLGLHTLIYNYTDQNGCTASDSEQVHVDLCTGWSIVANTSPAMNVLPNPNNGSFNIMLQGS